MGRIFFLAHRRIKLLQAFHCFIFIYHPLYVQVEWGEMKLGISPLIYGLSAITKLIIYFWRIKKGWISEVFKWQVKGFGFHLLILSKQMSCTEEMKLYGKISYSRLDDVTHLNNYFKHL